MHLTELIIHYSTAVISALGYFGVFLGMTLESMIAPVPSEAVLPFAGFLIESGRFTLFGVIFWGTLGSFVGSGLSYAMGRYGGVPFVRTFGKYLLLNEEHLAQSERFFSRYGQHVIFFARFVPVVRHFISIPAGAAKMNFALFSVYTVIGAGLWNAFLTIVGMKLGERWDEVKQYSGWLDYVMVLFIVIAFGYFFYHQLSKKRAASKAQQEASATAAAVPKSESGPGSEK
jgi:membrane protein DedA with SNARE-associated domain